MMDFSNDSYAANLVNKHPEALLHGGIQTNHGLIPQRMSYVLLHAMCTEPSEKANCMNLSETTVQSRQFAQAAMVTGIIKAWYSDAVVHSMFGGKDGIESRFALASKKPARALARLKDKHAHAKDYEGLISLMDDSCDANLVLTYSMYLCVVGGFPWKNSNFEISDDVWMSAIELVMILTAPHVYFNPESEEQWIRYIEPHYRLLWTLVYYITTAEFYSLFYSEHGDLLEEIKRYQKLVECYERDAKAHARDYENLKAQVAASKSGKDALIAQLQKEIDLLWHENEDLRGQLAGSVSEPDFVESVPQLETVDDVVEVSEGPDILIELPDDNILFIGGHPNMLSKLRPKYPDWRFVSTETNTKALPPDMRPEMIFIWSNHLNHPLSDKVKALYGNVPIGYVTATNIDRLESEMIDLYSQYRASLDD